jgi:hypothetical protein
MHQIPLDQVTAQRIVRSGHAADRVDPHVYNGLFGQLPLFNRTRSVGSRFR